MPAEKESSKGGNGRSSNSSCNRRSNKPLMEKRRRARINQSLAELKNLIIDACVKKEQTSRSSKLEKADILELTVRHVQSLQKQQSESPGVVVNGQEHLSPASPTPDSAGNSELVKYRAGFKECAKEVTLFMDTVEGFDAHLRRRLVNHLYNRLNQMPQTNDDNNNQQQNDSLANSLAELVQSDSMKSDDVISFKAENRSQTGSEKEKSLQPASQGLDGLHLIPTRLLPTGEIAFIWPSLMAAGSASLDKSNMAHRLYAHAWPTQKNSISGHHLKEEAMWRPW